MGRSRANRHVQEGAPRRRVGWKTRALVPLALIAAAAAVAGSAAADLAEYLRPAPVFHATAHVTGEPLPGLTQDTVDEALRDGPTGPTPLRIEIGVGDPASARTAAPREGVMSVVVSSRMEELTIEPSVGVTPPAELARLLGTNGGRDHHGLEDGLQANLLLGQTSTAVAAAASTSWAQLADASPRTYPPMVRWFVAGLLLLAACVALVPTRRRYVELQTSRSVWLGARRRVARVVLDLEALEVTALTAAPDDDSERLLQAYRRVRQRALQITAALDREVPGDAEVEEAAARAHRESEALAGEADALLLAWQLQRGGAAAQAAWELLAAPALRAVDRLNYADPASSTTHQLLALRPPLETLLTEAGRVPAQISLERWESICAKGLKLLGQRPPHIAATYSAATAAALSGDPAARAERLRSALATSVRVGQDLTAAIEARITDTAGARVPRRTVRHGGAVHSASERRFPWIRSVLVSVILGLVLAGTVTNAFVRQDRLAWREWLDRATPDPQGDFRVESVRLVGSTGDTDPSSELARVEAAVRAVPLPFPVRLTVVLDETGVEYPWRWLSSVRADSPELFDPRSLEPLPHVLLLHGTTLGNGNVMLDRLAFGRPNLDPNNTGVLSDAPQYPTRPRVDWDTPLAQQLADALAQLSTGPQRLADSLAPRRTHDTTGILGSAFLFFAGGGFLLWRVLWKRRQNGPALRLAAATRREFARASGRLDALALDQEELLLHAVVAQRWDAPSAADGHLVDARMHDRGLILALRWREELRAVPREALQDAGVRERFDRFARLVSTLGSSSAGIERSAREVMRESLERLERKGNDL